MNYFSANTAFQSDSVASAGADRKVVDWGGVRYRLTVSDTTIPADLATAAKRLEELMRLPVGWDGYAARPVSLSIAIFTLSILQNLSSPIVAPHIVPGTRGDVQVEFNHQDWSIELHLAATNVIHAWRSGPGLPDEGEEEELSTDVTVIQNWLDAIKGPGVAAQALG